MTPRTPIAMMALLLATVSWAAAPGQTSDHRTTPPTIDSVEPLGLARGAESTLKVTGLNLQGAGQVFFSGAGVQGKVVAIREVEAKQEAQRLGAGGLPSTIDLGPLPPRHEVTLAVQIEEGAAVGPRRFRLHTPLGVTLESKILVEPSWSARAEDEPNDDASSATAASLPAIFTGTISKPGDADYYRFEAKPGDAIVFWDAASQIGSALQPVMALLGPSLDVLREFGGHQTVPVFEHVFAAGGTYYLQVTDYDKSGGAGHSYRIQAGPIPLVESVYPLGFRRGQPGQISLQGFHVGPERISVDSASLASQDEHLLSLRPQTPNGPAFNEIKLDVGDDPEVESGGQNLTAAAAQRVTLPVTINGKLQTAGAHYFRFEARKDEPIVIEVLARRLGSDLDSVIEVLDTNGNPVVQATLRAVFETKSTVLLRTPSQPALRIFSWEGVEVGDYLMVGAEVLRVAHLPRGPDEDVLFEAIPPVPLIPLGLARNTQKLTFFNTTPEAHGLDKSVYEVEIHPPGSRFTQNGLPTVSLPFLNDDGGPGYDTDSRVDFHAPADGEYLVRLGDSRGTAGERHAYRLKLRPPRPGFSVTVDPENPNVPIGGRIPVVAVAHRNDGFDGPIQLEVVGLPAGVSADPVVIPSGQSATTLALRAAADAQTNQAAPFKLKATAVIAGQSVVRWASPEDNLKFVAVIPAPDLTVTPQTRQVILEPGGTATITVDVRRNNGFLGRVPLHVFNLPRHVDLPDSGLNGVMVDADQQQQSFTIRALPTAKPGEHQILIVGQVETRSRLQNLFSSEPVALKIVAPTMASN